MIPRHPLADRVVTAALAFENWAIETAYTLARGLDDERRWREERKGRRVLSPADLPKLPPPWNLAEPRTPRAPSHPGPTGLNWEAVITEIAD